MYLSYHTLMVALIVTSTTLGLAITVVAFRRYHALLICSWALGVALTLAYVLLALRGQISDVWSVVAANIALATTFAIFTEGVLGIQQRRPLRWLIWLPVPVVATSFFYWLDNLPARIIFGGLIFASQCLFIFVVLIQRRQATAGRGQYILMAGFLLGILTFISRIIAMLSGYFEPLSSLANSPVQTVSLLSFLTSLMFLATGLLLMTQEQTEHELTQNRELLKQQNRALQNYSDELETANRKLAELSVTDSLTGLFNRRHFDEVLAVEWARAHREKQPLALLMIDVDFFKNYNDHYGHKAGDDCLRNVASVLRSGSKRASDMTARYGGEEFAVITAGSDLDKARELAATLCRDVVALEIPHDQSPFGRITVSIGVAASVPEEKLTAEALLRRADEALYQAKESGRHRVVVG